MEELRFIDQDNGIGIPNFRESRKMKSYFRGGWLVCIQICFVAFDATPIQASEFNQEVAIEKTIELAKPALVTLWFGEDPMSHVTGTFITKDGLILTCAHLGKEVGEEVQIRTSDGKSHLGRVLAKSSKRREWGNDLALVQMNQQGTWPMIHIARGTFDSDQLMIALGYPESGLLSKPGNLPPLFARVGRKSTITFGSHSGVIRTTMRGSGGDSGGPILNLNGELIGVITNGDSSGSGLTFHTYERIRELWPQLAGLRPFPESASIKEKVNYRFLQQAKIPDSLRRLVVEIRSRERWVATGMIVAPRLILTKATELGPELTVVVENDLVGFAKIKAVDRVRDLALLELLADELTANCKSVPWTESKNQPIGKLVTILPASPFAQLSGTISTTPMAIMPREGSLGIEIEDGTTGSVRVRKVFSAELIATRLQNSFPLKADDVITHIQGKPVPNRAAYIQIHRDWPTNGEQPRITGEPVTVRFIRNGMAMEASYPLNAPSTLFQRVRPFSLRDSGFPNAYVAHFEHSRPELGGAPVIDLEGKVVGLYIAKAMGFEDLILPVSECLATLEKLSKAK